MPFESFHWASTQEHVTEKSRGVERSHKGSLEYRQDQTKRQTTLCVLPNLHSSKPLKYMHSFWHSKPALFIWHFYQFSCIYSIQIQYIENEGREKVLRLSQNTIYILQRFYSECRESQDLHSLTGSSYLDPPDNSKTYATEALILHQIWAPQRAAVLLHSFQAKRRQNGWLMM